MCKWLYFSLGCFRFNGELDKLRYFFINFFVFGIKVILVSLDEIKGNIFLSNIYLD